MKTKNIPWIKSPLVLLLICILVSCGKEKKSSSSKLGDCPVVATWKTVGSDKVLVGQAELLKDTLTIPLSQLVENFQLIKLDNRDEALVKGERNFVSKNYIAITGYQQPLKLFDHTGKYLGDIGKIGQGPNEYSSTIYHVQIDEDNDRIYLIPWANNRQILVYDLKGNYYPPIPLAYTAPKMSFYVDTKKGTVIVGVLPFKGGKCPVMFIQDVNGKVIQEVDSKPFEVVPDFSNEVTMQVTPENTNFYIWHWPAQQDSFYYYNYKENRLVPHYTMTYPEKEPPLHNYAELFSSYILGEISRGTVEIRPGVSVTLPPANYIIDKETGQGAYIKVINDFLDNSTIGGPTYAIVGDYFIQTYDPGNLLDILEARLASPAGLSEQQKKDLTELQKTLTVDDNDVVLLGTLNKDATINFSEQKVYVPLEIRHSSTSDQPSEAVGSPTPPPPPGSL
ncbi:6-bladed beta-propeller [Parabacteroides pacaensis]|uniref:6-bladed beta-propeller n=1 Tax=Parabacteroides pacaensis TaxID=2086575 RepID=UPI000D0F28B3|nr:6-bladed beta-propeller [Parabacteroides pacaensis]